MERKIGEIFEYKGEWYQCVNTGFSCADCDIKGDCSDTLIGPCTSRLRKDGKQAKFKKLEKVGVPYISSRNKKRYQLCRCFCLPIITKDKRIEIGDANFVGIEVKRNKEDMEEKKLNLKPFDIQKAKEGKPVCTRDERKARIICFDAKCNLPIIALITQAGGDESLARYNSNGRFTKLNESDCDLMMLTEKKEGWINVYNSLGVITFSHNPFDSKEEALAAEVESPNKYYVDTVKISWEE